MWRPRAGSRRRSPPYARPRPACRSRWSVTPWPRSVRRWTPAPGSSCSTTWTWPICARPRPWRAGIPWPGWKPAEGCGWRRPARWPGQASISSPSALSPIQVPRSTWAWTSWRTTTQPVSESGTDGGRNVPLATPRTAARVPLEDGAPPVRGRQLKATIFIAMPAIDRHDDVFVLDIGDTENRFHPDWLASVNDALDEVENAEGPRALVTAATGKFFSNGLDLDWLSAHPDDGGQYLAAVHDLLARVLALPVITVAALQGHTFAAGAMFSLAHDFRVMRSDRGYWCLPEADLNLPFTVGMSALIQARLTPQTAHQAMTTGRRYGGHDALAAAIVDRTADEHGVRQAAAEIARPQAAKAGPALGTIKTRMYAPVLDALRQKDY